MQQQKIIIEKANLQDVGYVRNLLVERAQWLKAQGIDQWQQFATYEQTTQIEKDYEQGVLFVAKNNDECVGAIVITPPQTFDEQLWEQPEGYLYVHRYVVALAASGTGVGGVLLAFAKKHAQQQTLGLRCDCRANNQLLQNYYQRLGVTTCGERNGYARFEFPLTAGLIDQNKPDAKISK